MYLNVNRLAGLFQDGWVTCCKYITYIGCECGLGRLVPVLAYRTTAV
jgi:hypothetical protein